MINKTVTMIVATTHRVPKYGGFSLHVDALHDMAEKLRGGTIPMVNNHDPSHPIDARILKVDVVEIEGESEWKLVVEAEIPADQWDQVEEGWATAGAPGGLSFSVSEPIASSDDDDSTQFAIRIAGDAAFFDDESLLAASRSMAEVGTVSAQRLYQFSEIEVARAIIEFAGVTLAAVPPNVLATAIWELVRPLFARLASLRPAEGADLQLELRDTASSRMLIIRAKGEEGVNGALEALANVLESDREFLEYREEVGEWTERLP